MKKTLPCTDGLLTGPFSPLCLTVQGHCGFTKGDNEDGDNWSIEQRDGLFSSGLSEESGLQIPTQAQTLVEGSATVAVSEYKPTPDIDYLMVVS